MPLRVPVLGHLDGHMGGMETRGNQVAANGVHPQLRMCTRLQSPRSLQRPFLPVQAHWRVVVATWHFHVFQRLQVWVFDKLQHAPSFVSNKRPAHCLLPGPRRR